MRLRSSVASVPEIAQNRQAPGDGGQQCAFAAVSAARGTSRLVPRIRPSTIVLRIERDATPTGSIATDGRRVRGQ